MASWTGQWLPVPHQPGPKRAHDLGIGSFEEDGDVPESDLLWTFGQPIAAVGAAGAVDDACLGELGENLGNNRLGKAPFLSNLQ